MPTKSSRKAVLAVAGEEAWLRMIVQQIQKVFNFPDGVNDLALFRDDFQKLYETLHSPTAYGGIINSSTEDTLGFLDSLQDQGMKLKESMDYDKNDKIITKVEKVFKMARLSPEGFVKHKVVEFADVLMDEAKSAYLSKLIDIWRSNDTFEGYTKLFRKEKGVFINDKEYRSLKRKWLEELGDEDSALKAEQAEFDEYFFFRNHFRDVDLMAIKACLKDVEKLERLYSSSKDKKCVDQFISMSDTRSYDFEKVLIYMSGPNGDLERLQMNVEAYDGSLDMPDTKESAEKPKKKKATKTTTRVQDSDTPKKGKAEKGPKEPTEAKAPKGRKAKKSAPKEPKVLKKGSRKE